MVPGGEPLMQGIILDCQATFAGIVNTQAILIAPHNLLSTSSLRHLLLFIPAESGNLLLYTSDADMSFGAY
jgi:hypothetical protein